MLPCSSIIDFVSLEWPMAAGTIWLDCSSWLWARSHLLMFDELCSRRNGCGAPHSYLFFFFFNQGKFIIYLRKTSRGVPVIFHARFPMRGTPLEPACLFCRETRVLLTKNFRKMCFLLLDWLFSERNSVFMRCYKSTLATCNLIMFFFSTIFGTATPLMNPFHALVWYLVWYLSSSFHDMVECG